MQERAEWQEVKNNKTKFKEYDWQFYGGGLPGMSIPSHLKPVGTLLLQVPEKTRKTTLAWRTNWLHPDCLYEHLPDNFQFSIDAACFDDKMVHDFFSFAPPPPTRRMASIAIGPPPKMISAKAIAQSASGN
jgi:hypothetical protein